MGSEKFVTPAAIRAFKAGWEAKHKELVDQGVTVAPSGTRTRAGLEAALPILLKNVVEDAQLRAAAEEATRKLAPVAEAIGITDWPKPDEPQDEPEDLPDCIENPDTGSHCGCVDEGLPCCYCGV